MFNCQQMFAMPNRSVFRPTALHRLVVLALMSWPVAQAQNIDPGARMLGDMERARRAAEQSVPAPSAEAPAPQEIQDIEFSGRVVLQEIRFSPSELLSADQLRELANSVLNRSLSSADLKDFLQTIQKLYLAKGIEHAAPVLPPQDLKSGVLQVPLVEGRLGKIRTAEGLDLDLDRLSAWWRQTSGQIIRSNTLQEDLSMLNAASEMNLQGQLVAGSEFAQSDWLLSLTEGGRSTRWAQMEWAEGEQTGRTGRQLVAGLKVAPLGRLGQRLDVTAVASPSAQTVSLNLSWPLSARGWRLNTGLSRSQSEGTVASSTAGAPDLALQGRSGSTQIELGHWFDTQVLDSLRASAQLAQWTSHSQTMDQVLTDRKIQRLNAALAGDWRTHVGEVPQALSLNWRTGWTVGKSSSGDYSFVDAGLSGNWVLHAPSGWQARFNAVLRARAKQAPDAMDVWQIGGPSTVRGFAQGSAYGQSGHAVQVSLVKPWLLGEQGGELMLMADQGSARNASGVKVLASSGLGATWRVGKQQSLEVQYTRQGRGESGPNSERLLLRLSLVF